MKNIYSLLILIQLLAFQKINAQLVELPITNVEVISGDIPENIFDVSAWWHLGNDFLLPDASIIGDIPPNTPAGGRVIFRPTTQIGFDYISAHPYLSGNGTIINGRAEVYSGLLSGSMFNPFSIIDGSLDYGVSPDGSVARFENPSANLFVKLWAAENEITGNFNNELIPQFMRANFKLFLNYGGDIPLDEFVPGAQVTQPLIIRRRNVDFTREENNLTFSFTPLDIDFSAHQGFSFTDNGFVDGQFFTQAGSYEIDLSSGTKFTTFDNFGNFSLFDFNSFDGVDFTNLKVDAIDLDLANANVNFILKGDIQNGNGNNLQQNAEFYKKVFLQALSIPSDEWFVSLDRNPAPLARATAAFKQTDIARIFFEADAKLKNEMFNHFHNSGIYNNWFQILKNDDEGMLVQLLLSGKNIIPTVEISGRFLPDIPDSKENGDKISVDDAQYILDMDLDNASLNLNGQNLTQAQRNFLTGSNWTTFVNQMNNRLAQLTTIVENRINSSAIPEYRAMNEILPVMVAAKWYKQSNVDNKQFEYLIDTRQTGAQVPGVDLTPDQPFNQGYWNNQANRLIGTVNLRYGGFWSSDLPVRGGVDLGGTTLNSTPLNNNRNNSINTTLKKQYIDAGAQKSINAGRIKNSLVDLSTDLIRVRDINGTALYNRFPVNRILKGEVVIRNLSSSFDYDNPEIKIQNLNLQSGNATEVDAVINKIPENNLFGIGFDLSALSVGKYRLTVVVDPSNLILEKDEFNNSISLEYEIVNNDNNCLDLSIADPVSVDASKVELACSIDISNTITANNEYKLIAKSKIEFKPGFNFKAQGNNILNGKTQPESFSFGNTSNRSASRLESGITLKESANILSSKVQPLRKRNLTKLRDEERRSLGHKLYRVLPEVGQSKLTILPIDEEEMNYIEAIRNKPETDFVSLELLNLGEENSSDPINEVVRVFPNPTIDELTLELLVDQQRIIEVSINSIDGKFSKNLIQGRNVEAGVFQEKFDVRELPNGIYLLTVVTDDGIIKNKTIIKK